MPLIASPSVLRAGHVLKFLADDPTSTFSASDLARSLSIPRATCNSLLLGLLDLGLVRRSDSREWSLDRGCIVLGDAARRADSALRISSTHAEELSIVHALTTAVTMRNSDMTRVAAVFRAGSSAVAPPQIGDSIGLVPPFGATFIAWASEEEIDAWLDHAQPALNDAERSRYLVALKAVRDRGYSITVTSDPQARFAAALERINNHAAAQEQIKEILGEIAHSDYLTAELAPTGLIRVTQLSSPVFDTDGHVVASIMAMGPDREITVEEATALGRLVLRSSSQATQSLGGRRTENPQ
jgi:DNA-binding IclR family transcriptional regulator